MDIAAVDKLLTTTRSVRKRLDLTRPVGRDVILECTNLRNSLTARPCLPSTRRIKPSTPCCVSSSSVRYTRRFRGDGRQLCRALARVLERNDEILSARAAPPRLG